MTELLKRWGARQPALCGLTHPDHSQRWVQHSGQRWYFFEHDRASYAHVLAAVIEAIEARGGSWELRGSGCPASARVTLNGAARGCVADEPTDPPAFPLLAAYLAALEAQEGNNP